MKSLKVIKSDQINEALSAAREAADDLAAARASGKQDEIDAAQAKLNQAEAALDDALDAEITDVEAFNKEDKCV